VRFIEASSRLEDTTYFVTVFEGGKPLNPETTISSGSAVAITTRGDLLTAAHVITGSMPPRKDVLEDPNVITLARKKGGQFIQYVPGRLALGLNNPAVRETLYIDLGLLRPLSPQEHVPFLEIDYEPVKVGCEVLMAGYPDDMEQVFSVDRKLRLEAQGVQRIHRDLRANQLLMIKSAMIGHRSGFNLSDGKRVVEGDILYADNELHSGASGGPIVSLDSKLVGIIAQRAVTSISTDAHPGLRVPSGSTVAFSPRAIKDWIAEIAD